MSVYIGDTQISGVGDTRKNLTTDNFKEKLINDATTSEDTLWSSQKVADYTAQCQISMSGTTIPYRLFATCTKSSSHKYMYFDGGAKYNASVSTKNNQVLNNAYIPFSIAVNDVGSSPTVNFNGYMSEVPNCWDIIITTDGTTDYCYFWVDLSGTNPNLIARFRCLYSGWSIIRTDQTAYSEIPSGQTVVTSLRTYTDLTATQLNGRVVSLSQIGDKFTGLYEKTFLNKYSSGSDSKHYVLPLLDITSASSSIRFLNGTLAISRENGAETPVRIDIGLSKRYSKSADTLYWVDRWIINDSYFYNSSLTNAKEYALPVTFTYNGRDYFGIKFDSRLQWVQFVGVYYSAAGLQDVFAKISSYYEDLITSGDITNAIDVDIDSLTTPLEIHHDVKIKGTTLQLYRHNCYLYAEDTTSGNGQEFYFSFYSADSTYTVTDFTYAQCMEFISTHYGNGVLGFDSDGTAWGKGVSYSFYGGEVYSIDKDGNLNELDDSVMTNCSIHITSTKIL